MNILLLILLIFALVCFAINSFPNTVSRLSLDQAGKAFLVGALIAYVFG